MPFFEGRSSPSWSQYYRILTYVLFLNQLTVNLFLFPKDQKTSPSLFFSLTGLSNYFSPSSSSSDQDFSFFLFLSIYIFIQFLRLLSSIKGHIHVFYRIYLGQLLLSFLSQFRYYLLIQKMLEWLFGKKKEEPKPEVQQKKKKKKTQAEQETQDRWQYEFLVQFLNSPLWRVSILDFVDQSCVVFDSQQQNKFQYTKIHNQFKQLVGSLFDGMMREIGLDDDKLVQLLEKGFESKEKKLFNQLLLCDDFLKFKELMVKRNKALEAQALKAINGQQRRASTLDKQRSLVHSSLKSQQTRKKQLEQQQQEVLRKVLQMSRLEAQEKKQIQKLAERANELEEQKLIHEKQERQRKARQEAAREEQIKAQNEKSKKQIQQIQKQTQEKLKSKVNKPKNLEPLANQNKLGDLPPIKTVKKQPQFISEKKEQIVVAEPKKEVEVKQEIKEQAKGQSSQERKKRLLEQRQKMRKKKQEERKKMLEEEEVHNKKTMNIVLQDDNIHDSVHPSVNEADQKISKDQIERRKEIMRKIKNRIVDDF